jgi:hypothetical protein
MPDSQLPIGLIMRYQAKRWGTGYKLSEQKTKITALKITNACAGCI